MSASGWKKEYAAEVQRLALTGYGSDFARHLLLQVLDPHPARQFVAGLLKDDLITFGDRGKEGSMVAVNIGFTFRGLRLLGVRASHLEVIATKSEAFANGAAPRAARYLGDAGASAAELWEPPFADGFADVWIALHGPDARSLDEMVKRLCSMPGAKRAFEGWQAKGLDAAHLGTDRSDRRVHFGFRDNITRPVIREGGSGAGHNAGELPLGYEIDSHNAGELLLGFENDPGVNLWGDLKTTPCDVVPFVRNASFAVLRKIEQDEGQFNEWLHQQSCSLQSAGHFQVTKEYLKAKMCGRWSDGTPLRPEDSEPPSSEDRAARLPTPGFRYATDPDGQGCPFGAHIRRSNPRDDPIAPPTQRVLFRRGMPYGPAHESDPEAKRGLMGVFFCASIDDQFERLISEWVEKRPMGPPNQGRAKDPLIGHHDDPEAGFLIPQGGGTPPIELRFPKPFVTTRGTLYAMFLGRKALEGIAEGHDAASRRARVPDIEGDARALRAAADPDTLDPGGAPSDRFCDIVMEGGVTSGIIYAKAVAKLSGHYRFKNIGGSSIGAFAAALTAAAEFRRRQGSGAGFEALDQLPGRLAQEDGQGRTLLQRLFVPQQGTRRLFQIFLAALDKDSVARSVRSGAVEAARQYLRLPKSGLCAGDIFVLLAVVLPGIIAALSIRFGPVVPAPAAWVVYLFAWVSWCVAVLLALGVLAAGTVVFGVVRDLTAELVPNGFGLCRGWRPEAKEGVLDLAGFLHVSIQEVAGLDPLDDKPLTFADLWHAPGAPADVLGYEATGVDARSINLEVYTSNLAHGRPYRLPLDEHPPNPDRAAEFNEDMGRLFFKVDELAQYFPKQLVQYLASVSKSYAQTGDADPPAGPKTDGFLELPVGDLPIVVAARLAMSFPGLISAIPLYAIDYEPAHRADRSLQKCWMSDGGLCSNFPIHLFDSWVPRWPTFGISLQSRSQKRPGEEVWLPKLHRDGRGDTWDRRLTEGPSLGRLGAFVTSLWLTAWHWNDSTMMRMPGVRDRVARVYLGRGEGGVNIRMTGPQIEKISAYGSVAAQALIDKFIEKPGKLGSCGWREHRWVRLNVLLVALRDRVQRLKQAIDLDLYTIPLDRAIKSAAQTAPLRGPPRVPWPSETPLTVDQQAELRELLVALEELESAFVRAGERHPFAAIPRPAMRIRHPT